MTLDNIRYFASTLHSSASIQDRVIHFGAGSNNDLLLEVPLGTVHPHSTIIITVGLDKSHPNTPGTESDLYIGISDGTIHNIQIIFDVYNYRDHAPCEPASGTHDNRLIPSAQVSSTFKLTFVPYSGYTVCETAQTGGYLNTGRFNNRIDTSKPLFLRVVRDSGIEQLFIHYFMVEILTPPQD